MARRNGRNRKNRRGKAALPRKVVAFFLGDGGWRYRCDNGVEYGEDQLMALAGLTRMGWELRVRKMGICSEYLLDAGVCQAMVVARRPFPGNHAEAEVEAARTATGR